MDQQGYSLEAICAGLSKGLAHTIKETITIGIPETIYLLEHLPFWKLFFGKLGCRVYVSPPRGDFLGKGTEIAGAEFCAPLAYWHGLALDVSRYADYVFLPVMLSGEETAVSMSTHCSVAPRWSAKLCSKP